MAEMRIEALIRRQHGVITRRQAMDAGMSPDQIYRRLKSGVWVSTYRGVYRHHMFQPTWHSGLAAGCLAVDGLATDRSGAVLHRLEGYHRKGRRHVLVPRGRRRRARHVPNVAVHESKDFHLAAATVVDGIPCTGLRRTVLDVAATSSHQQLGAAVDALLRDRRVRLVDLYHELAKHGGRGRPGCSRLRKVLDERRGEERVPLSKWSRMVAELLVLHGLPEPALEYRVQGPDGEFVAQIDVGYPRYTISIELDSVGWHFNLESFQSDRERSNKLVVLGWTPLSFTWDDFSKRPGKLCATVRATLRQNGWSGAGPAT